MVLTDLLTISANDCGYPAASSPAGFSGKLPVGVQFMGPYLQDEKVLQAMAWMDAK